MRNLERPHNLQVIKAAGQGGNYMRVLENAVQVRADVGGFVWMGGWLLQNPTGVHI